MDLFKKKPKAPRTPFVDPKHDYANATLWSDFKERIVRRTLKGERIYIEMTGYVEIIDGDLVGCPCLSKAQKLPSVRRPQEGRIWPLSLLAGYCWHSSR